MKIMGAVLGFLAVFAYAGELFNPPLDRIKPYLIGVLRLLEVI
jgi:hypothetical protein